MICAFGGERRREHACRTDRLDGRRAGAGCGGDRLQLPPPGRRGQGLRGPPGPGGGEPGEVASRETSSGDTKLKIALNQLRRAGSLTTLNLSVTNLTADQAGGKFQGADLLDDGATNGSKGPATL